MRLVFFLASMLFKVVHYREMPACLETDTFAAYCWHNHLCCFHLTLSAQPMSTSPPPNNKDAEYVKVVFQYTPEQSDELELVVNDFLQVLSRDLPEEGWWRGLNIRTNKTGVFPDNFVKMADSNDPDFKRALADFKVTDIPIQMGFSRVINSFWIWSNGVIFSQSIF